MLFLSSHRPFPGIKIDRPITWQHHRSGWGYVMHGLLPFHQSDGILFSGWLEGLFLGMREGDRPYQSQIITEPFIGFLHNAPTYNANDEYRDKYEKTTAIHVFGSPLWLESSCHCRGIFTLSTYLARFVKQYVSCPVSVLRHPTEPASHLFSFDKFIANPQKKLLHIGSWMRNYHPFFTLQAGKYQKVLIRAGYNHFDRSITDKLSKTHAALTTIDHVPNQEYDNLLAANIVFLNLLDASANNVIIECIVRHTPLLVNPLEAVVEYLGEDYPLYYNTLEEASEKLLDENLIGQASTYLASLPTRNDLTLEHFISSFFQSDVMKNATGKLHIPHL